MPKPAAAFSTLAITRSAWWCSTTARRPWRTRSRPGRPTMSPMKRSRTADSLRDGDGNPAASAIVDLRNRDAQFATGQRGACLRRVAGTVEAHDAREPPVAALDQVKARLARAWRRLLAR